MGTMPLDDSAHRPRPVTPTVLETWNAATSHDSDPQTALDYLNTEFFRSLNAIKRRHDSSVRQLEEIRSAIRSASEVPCSRVTFEAIDHSVQKYSESVDLAG